MMLRIASVIVFCVLLSEAHKLDDERVNHKYWKEFQEFAKWKRTKELNDYSVNFVKRPIGFNDHRAQRTSIRAIQDPPPKDQPALVARYVVNQADWTSIATISTRKDIATFPAVNLVSVSDGPIGNGTGIPYMYVTPLDFTTQDLAIYNSQTASIFKKRSEDIPRTSYHPENFGLSSGCLMDMLCKDHRASLLMSLAQENYCQDKNMDPMDPRCARVMLTGKIVAVKNDTTEHETAKRLFFERHPHLENMPADHEFFFVKMNFGTDIVLLNNFGGPKYISVEDYFHPVK